MNINDYINEEAEESDDESNDEELDGDVLKKKHKKYVLYTKILSKN